MKHVICSLPNASDLINYIAFQDHAEGKITVDPVDDDVAARFGSIPGFKVVDAGQNDNTPPADPVIPPVDTKLPELDAPNAAEAAVVAIETAVAAVESAPAEVAAADVKKNPVPANFQKKAAK